jgi:hypothetical protein
MADEPQIKYREVVSGWFGLRTIRRTILCAPTISLNRLTASLSSLSEVARRIKPGRTSIGRSRAGTHHFSKRRGWGSWVQVPDTTERRTWAAG